MAARSDVRRPTPWSILGVNCVRCSSSYFQKLIGSIQRRANSTADGVGRASTALLLWSIAPRKCSQRPLAPRAPRADLPSTAMTRRPLSHARTVFRATPTCRAIALIGIPSADATGESLPNPPL